MVERISRSSLLTRAGAVLAGIAGLGAWRFGSAPAAAGAVGCVLTPEMTEGLYYISGEKLRRNITAARTATCTTRRT